MLNNYESMDNSVFFEQRFKFEQRPVLASFPWKKTKPQNGRFNLKNHLRDIFYSLVQFFESLTLCAETRKTFIIFRRNVYYEKKINLSMCTIFSPMIRNSDCVKCKILENF